MARATSDSHLVYPCHSKFISSTLRHHISLSLILTTADSDLILWLAPLSKMATAVASKPDQTAAVGAAKVPSTNTW